MSLYVGPGNGLELISRQAVITLTASLNDEINSVSAHWAPLDIELATLRGLTYASCPMQEVANNHIHQGHRPSLINAPLTEFPNVSCMAYKAMPDAEQLDTIDKFSNSLYIECFVHGTEEEGEETVNKRIQRLTESIVNVIARDNRLGGNFLNIQRPPIISIGDLFVRKEEKGRGPRFLWQGSRLEYMVDVYTEPRNVW